MDILDIIPITVAVFAILGILAILYVLFAASRNIKWENDLLAADKRVKEARKIWSHTDTSTLDMINTQNNLNNTIINTDIIMHHHI
jgi:hypothetical protein